MAFAVAVQILVETGSKGSRLSSLPSQHRSNRSDEQSISDNRSLEFPSRCLLDQDLISIQGKCHYPRLNW